MSSRHARKYAIESEMETDVHLKCGNNNFLGVSSKSSTSPSVSKAEARREVARPAGQPVRTGAAEKKLRLRLRLVRGMR